LKKASIKRGKSEKFTKYSRKKILMGKNYLEFLTKNRRKYYAQLNGFPVLVLTEASKGAAFRTAIGR